jgi:hypothetical protein
MMMKGRRPAPQRTRADGSGDRHFKTQQNERARQPPGLGAARRRQRLLCHAWFRCLIRSATRYRRARLPPIAPILLSLSLHSGRNNSGSLAIFAAIRRASVGRQPSCGSIGAVFGSRIKCDHGSRSGFMDRINNRFKDCEALRG